MVVLAVSEQAPTLRSSNVNRERERCIGAIVSNFNQSGHFRFFQCVWAKLSNGGAAQAKRKLQPAKPQETQAAYFTITDHICGPFGWFASVSAICAGARHVVNVYSYHRSVIAAMRRAH
jgi:hypothetical protein